MSSVEAKLRDLIQHKRNLLDQVNSDINEITRRRDALHNQVLELESLFPRDADPAGEPGQEFGLGDQVAAMAKPRYQAILEEEDDLPNTPAWGSVPQRKGRPMKDYPQA